jgi:hypothetical protein
MERIKKEFIAWDGEGISYNDRTEVVRGLDGTYWNTETRKMMAGYEPVAQTYVLLANSKGTRKIAQYGLSTIDCLEFILDTKEQYPNSIFVGYGFNYDINQMLKDLSWGKLRKIHEDNTCRYGRYFIRWNPGKKFLVKDMESDRPTTIIYDTLSFFQQSFLETCKKYLGEDDPRLTQIAEGKATRNIFDWEELDSKIIPYNDKELEMFVEIMNKLRDEFESFDLFLRQWHGPGAAVDDLYKQKKIQLDKEIRKEVLYVSQFAYSGGRIEQLWMGYGAGPIYEYDINSAYPEAITKLPDITKGTWEHVKKFEPGSFGIWAIEYKSNDGDESNIRPQPLFCRAQNGLISYPRALRGWYWTPEAELVPDCVKAGWVFRPFEETRPFAFVEEMYHERQLLKDKKDPLERVLKTLLTSMYGKFAQTIGSSDGPPKWHQLEYAGYITSYTRAKMYRAMMINPDIIISAETDAIFSKESLDLPLSTNLGDWKLKIHEDICYLQSGFYYVTTNGVESSKYRGLDKDLETGFPSGLDYGYVLEHLLKETGNPWTYPESLIAYTNRFINIGMALQTSLKWRSWDRSRRLIRLHDRRSRRKRNHIIKECPQCQAGVSMFDAMHPMTIGGYSGACYPKYIEWLEDLHTIKIDWTEYKKQLALEELERWS